jgi:isoprene synthase
LQEAKWSYNNITPSFVEYLENAWRSVSRTVILIHAYFLLGENISKQALDYLVNYDELRTQMAINSCFDSVMI